MYQSAFQGSYSNPAYNGDRTVKASVNKLINSFIQQDKYVAALCHGTSVLAWARVNNRSVLAGKRATGPVLPGAERSVRVPRTFPCEGAVGSDLRMTYRWVAKALDAPVGPPGGASPQAMGVRGSSTRAREATEDGEAREPPRPSPASHEQRDEHQGDGGEQLDEHVERRASSVLERITDRVAHDRCAVHRARITRVRAQGLPATAIALQPAGRWIESGCRISSPDRVGALPPRRPEQHVHAAAPIEEGEHVCSLAGIDGDGTEEHRRSHPHRARRRLTCGVDPSRSELRRSSRSPTRAFAISSLRKRYL